MTAEVNILIADDHPVVRNGLRQAIEADPMLKVVAEVSDGVAALARIEELCPQIAVLDIDMPKLDGLGVAREIGKRGIAVQVVFLTIHSEEDLFHTAMDLGAKGYIVKESVLVEIVNGLRTVAAGQYYVSPPVTAYLMHRRNRSLVLVQNQPKLKDLTPTENRILGMIADGKSSKEIADELCIHFRTVDNHRTAICQKLGLRGPNALLRFALQNKSAL